MYFKNEAHKTAFVHAAKKANAKDRRLMCKLYLLTADRALWRAAKRESNGGKYPLGRIRLAFGTESSNSSLLCKRPDARYGSYHRSRSCRQGSSLPETI